MSKEDKKFRVWVSQVNQCFVEVSAKSKEEARAKGYRKWLKDYAQSYVADVEEVKNI